MKWMGKVATVSLAVVLAAGCSSEETDTKMEKAAEKDGMPVVHLMVQDHDAPLQLGSYSIKGEQTAFEAEKGPVEEIAKESDPIAAEPADLVQLYYDEEGPELEKTYVRLWENNTATDVKLTDGQFILPKETGTYIYEVLSYFENGDTQHVFTIRIE